MSEQQLKFLEKIVDVAKQQSDTLHGSAKSLADALAVRSDERTVLEKMKNSQNERSGREGVPGFGEKNETVRQFFAEMGRALLDDMERPLEELGASLQRVRMLTRYFSEYSGALLPSSHDNQWGKGTDDSKRLLEKYRLVRDRVIELRNEVQERSDEERSASQAVDRLERQAKIDDGASAGTGDAAVDEKTKDRETNAKDALERKKAERDGYKRDYKASVEKLKEAQKLEVTACKQLQDQMVQFEYDRAEFMQLTLGDLFHGGLSYHAQALHKYARLCEYKYLCSGHLPAGAASSSVPAPLLLRLTEARNACVPDADNGVMEMAPDNIENDTHFLKARAAQTEAKLTMDVIKKKAAAQAAEDREAGKK